MPDPTPADVVRRPGRFTLDLDDGTAIAAFQRDPTDNVLVFVHTEVPRDARGHGVAETLITGAFADIRAKHERVVALCPYVAAYLRRHPESQDLVADR